MASPVYMRPLGVFLITLLCGCAAARPERATAARRADEAHARLAAAEQRALRAVEHQERSVVEVDSPVAPDVQAVDPQTRFRPGDFALPNALLVAYDADWEEPLVELIQAAREEVDVYVLANAEELADYRFFAWLSRHDADVVYSSHDTPWVRDFGPMQVFDGRGSVVWLDFQYSTERKKDDASPIEVATHLGMPIERHQWWLDGGALLSNGRGFCVISDVSLGTLGIVDDDPEERAEFQSAVGCERLAVIPALPGEETGHADLIAQFLDERTVAISEVDPRDAPRTAQTLESAVRILSDVAEAADQPLDVVRVPMRVLGRTFYSYVNATRLPGKLIVPRYRATRDLEARAYRALSEALPGIRLVPVEADAMVSRGGAVHCVTLGLNVSNRDIRVARAPRRWLGASDRSRR